MPKKPKGLTVKESKLVKGIVQGKTKTQAALDAYNTTDPKTASVIAAEALGKPRVKEALEFALEEAGLTVKSVIDVVSDAMKAEKLVVVGNGEDAMADLQPDHNIRLRAAQMAGKYIGMEDKPQDQTPTEVHFHQHIDKQKEEYGL